MKAPTFDKASPDQKTLPDRRNFLKTVGVASSAAGLGAVMVPVTIDEAEAYDPGADQTKARYRLTDDVKAFYRTNGYETLKTK